MYKRYYYANILGENTPVLARYVLYTTLVINALLYSVDNPKKVAGKE